MKELNTFFFVDVQKGFYFFKLCSFSCNIHFPGVNCNELNVSFYQIGKVSGFQLVFFHVRFPYANVREKNMKISNSHVWFLVQGGLIWGFHSFNWKTFMEENLVFLNWYFLLRGGGSKRSVWPDFCPFQFNLAILPHRVSLTFSPE